MSTHRVVCIDYWAGELCNVAFSNFQERRREEKKSYALYMISFFSSLLLSCLPHSFSLGLLSWMCSACWTDSFKLFLQVSCKLRVWWIENMCRGCLRLAVFCFLTFIIILQWLTHSGGASWRKKKKKSSVSGVDHRRWLHCSGLFQTAAVMPGRSHWKHFHSTATRKPIGLTVTDKKQNQLG